MFQRIPNFAELAIFLVLALVCTLVVAVTPQRDSAIFFCAMPLFFVCSMLGLRHSRQFAALPEAPTQPAPADDAPAQ